MTVLSSKKILQEKNTTDPNSITSLNLTHKALTDVSCLSEFKNLEKLDLAFNNLTSLEGLKSCLNLKWLSVSQNMLQSLKGIEGLTKLTVLNAGKNKLKSVDEVKSLTNLCALILNDNELRSICSLDQMKDLNTLVLSRNPIGSVDESFGKLKAITKLSLSNCQLQSIHPSVKNCTELKELRLAHNEIMAVPDEFAHLVKLQNLDMGYNLISSWSNLKVLSALVHLRNLNLQGNLVAEKENLVGKVKKLLPNLHIFNSKPIDKIMKKDVKEVDTEDQDGITNKAVLGSGHKRKERLDKQEADLEQKNTVSEKQKKRTRVQQNEANMTDVAETMNVNPDEMKHKKQKRNKLVKEKTSEGKLDAAAQDSEPAKKKSRKSAKKETVTAIDDGETPFAELFSGGAPETSLEVEAKILDHKKHSIDALSGVVTLAAKKKKRDRVINPAALELLGAEEIGLGGPSAWD